MDITTQVLKLLDRYGIMTRKQMLNRLNVTDKYLRTTLTKLEKLGFTKTYKGMKEYAHYITAKGSEYIGFLNFGYVKGDKQPNLATLKHNLLMNDAILEGMTLIAQETPHSSIEIVTEREILAEKYVGLEREYKGKGLRLEKAKVRHKIPDFYLLVPIEDEVRRIAFEVELTRKSKKALDTKLKWYVDKKRNGFITQVCYMYEDMAIADHVAINAHRLNLGVQFHHLSSGSD